ncbi:MFS transporter [Carnimonas bestiolae]|uniref:MFS transporter n=1 Tax=Carnimonas bestiolae TaxID=3402172 RepID=UPI003EDBC1F9
MAKGNHPPRAFIALWLSTLAFALCFAAWTLLSIVGVSLKLELGLTPSQLSFLIAIPVLAGSVSRPFLGMLTERFGGRLIMSITLMVSAVFVYLLLFTTSYIVLLLIALGLGLAGGSFAVGVAHVSSWFDKKEQGTALGIFGMGMIGTAVNNLAGPLLQDAIGWRGTIEIYALGLLVMGILFIAIDRDPPSNQGVSATIAERLAPLRDLRVWRFSFFYFVNFGAFVALTLWLPQVLMNIYGLSLTNASLLTLLFTLPGSLGRGIGGWFSDRYGARVMMYLTLSVSLVCAFLLSYPPISYRIQGVDGPIDFSLTMGLIPMLVLLFVLACFMSMGMAAVFKYIPAHYPESVGTVGGIVGMVGGLGGFFLPIVFGLLNSLMGIWQSCFMLVFVITLLALLWLHLSIVRSGERRALPNRSGAERV